MSFIVGYFRSFGLKGKMMDGITSREDRRVERYLAARVRIQSAVEKKILEQLYEETRPRDESCRRSAGYVDDEEGYPRRIQAVQVSNLSELCEMLERWGVVNTRRIHSSSERLQVIDRALRCLIEAGKVEADDSGTTFWLAYHTYQVAACQDDGRRQARQKRYDDKRLRRQLQMSMSVAS